jgi:hypothetical protein
MQLSAEVRHSLIGNQACHVVAMSWPTLKHALLKAGDVDEFQESVESAHEMKKKACPKQCCHRQM